MLVLPLLTSLFSMDPESTTVNGQAARSLLLDENSKVCEDELIRHSLRGGFLRLRLYKCFVRFWVARLHG